MNGARGGAVLGRMVREDPSEKAAFSGDLEEGKEGAQRRRGSQPSRQGLHHANRGPRATPLWMDVVHPGGSRPLLSSEPTCQTLFCG